MCLPLCSAGRVSSSQEHWLIAQKAAFISGKQMLPFLSKYCLLRYSLTEGDVGVVRFWITHDNRSVCNFIKASVSYVSGKLRSGTNSAIVFLCTSCQSSCRHALVALVVKSIANPATPGCLQYYTAKKKNNNGRNRVNKTKCASEDWMLLIPDKSSSNLSYCPILCKIIRLIQFYTLARYVNSFGWTILIYITIFSSVLDNYSCLCLHLKQLAITLVIIDS